MSTMLPRHSTAPLSGSGPPTALCSGDRISRDEYHRLYEQTPNLFKAELIAGTVYVASPDSLLHSRPHSFLHHALLSYESRTAGVQTLANATMYLADESEPQPDLAHLVKDNEQPSGPEGILMSFQFPGLWIDGHAVRGEDLGRLTSTLEAGLATPEHAAFARRLADAKG